MSKQKILAGKRALVTGASSGIGEEFARQLAALGADLVIAARRLDRLEQLAERIRKDHAIQVDCVRSDLAQPDAAAALFDAATRGGKKIHILVNNAGIGPFGPFMDKSLEQHRDTIQVNVGSLTDLAYRAAEHMLAHGEESWISNVGSIASFQATGHYVVYSATKQYVRAFSEALCYELRKSNVHVHCLCPGGTYTEFMQANGQELTESAKSVMMSAEEVVRIGLDTMFRKQNLIVPGFLNKLATFLPRFVPRSLALHFGTKALERNAKVAEAAKRLPGDPATENAK